MTPQTRTVLKFWPTAWVEWDYALDVAQRSLPWSRRSIANRAAWLRKHGHIEWFWAERSEGWPPKNIQAVCILTRRSQLGQAKEST